MQKIWVGIIIGAAIVLMVFIVGRMAYDAGIASGKYMSSKKSNDCLVKCNRTDNTSIACYQKRCYDICLTEGIGYNNYYYPPFPF